MGTKQLVRKARPKTLLRRDWMPNMNKGSSFPDLLAPISTRCSMRGTRTFALVVCSLLLVLLPSPLALAAGTFTPTANMATSRFSHTMTLLAGGNVLVAGAASHPALPNAELYDPLSRTFSPAPGMSPRIGHTSTLLPNGSVLIAGGTGELALSTAEIYDPLAGTFTATGSMTTTRAFATATLLPNGEVLVAGGYQFNHPLSAQSSAELYRPAPGAFTATGSMTGSRTNHTATLLPNGTVLVVGGIDATQFFGLTTAEIYDPASQTFTPTGALSQGRGFQTATLLPNGNVLIAGGADGFPGPSLISTEIYDANTHLFSPGPDMSVPRVDHVASALTDGSVLIAGGFTASAEIYDPDTNSFVPAGDMSTPRGRHASAVLANGNVLITGGLSQSFGTLESGEVFSFGTTANQLPIGTHDAFAGDVAGPECFAGGWAVDPDDPYARLTVRITADGSVIGDTTADLFRQDLVDAGVSPDGFAGFVFDLRGHISVGESHSILVEAQDAQTSAWQPLDETPKVITCADSPPMGTHDGNAGNQPPWGCLANGWALDPDDRTARLTVRILADDVGVATTVADLFRQDLIDAGVSPDGLAGFTVYLWDLITSGELHEIRTQALDTQTGEWIDLEATPMSLSCSVPSPSSNIGFTGQWTATDLDGSALKMHIGPGDTPQVSYYDSYSTVCDNDSSPHWVGAGKGEYFEIWLFVTFNKPGCDPLELQFYWDEGSDTVWEDEDGDGIGITWYRTAG